MLEKLGFKPIHYFFSMTLDDYNQFSPPDVPPGFDIHIKEEIEDYESGVQVVNEAFKDSFLWKEVRPRKWKKLQEKFKKNHVVGYGIAYDKKNKVVGFCQYYLNPSQADLGLINTLSVHPSYHHRGIGSALLASGVEFLRDNGCKTINLPVDAKNEKALKMYEKFGFYETKNLKEKTYRLI